MLRCARIATEHPGRATASNIVLYLVANQRGKSMFGNEPLRADSRTIAKALAMLRIVTALLFLQHGTAKILGFPWWESMAFPKPWTLFWVAGWIELVGACYSSPDCSPAPSPSCWPAKWRLLTGSGTPRTHSSR